jgi:predicted amidophosphoribosyltransferase
LACSSVSRYGGAGSDVIKSMKYASRKAIAVMMGKIIAGRVMRPEVDILVPIPLHKGSEREYNQTELIARGASALWGIPVKNCLRWAIYYPSQASSSDYSDRALSSGAMEAVCDVRSMRALLVDDVCTTGNTLMTAAIAMTRAGALVREAVTWCCT